MLPTKEQAEKLLREAEICNPGPWGNHSRTAAHCAERIAFYCDDMDSEKAYVLGLLHDIGRKFGTRHLGHVSDGYSYMMSLGYDMEDRMNDVRRRYGYYSQQKWDSNMALRVHFEEKMGMDLYKVVEKDTFRPE